MTSLPQVGDTVNFYRDKAMPGSRGPFAAQVTSVIGAATSQPSVLLNLFVTGPMGGQFKEFNVPIVDDDKVDAHEARCCSLKRQ